MLRETLKLQAERLGLSRRIEWRGARPQPEVLAAYREADLFVLASKVAADGDRDGLPNVLIEAQSQRLGCVSTNVSAIPELIEDGVTGVLTEPGDPLALSRAMASLIRDPARRERLGLAGEARVRSLFSMGSGNRHAGRAVRCADRGKGGHGARSRAPRRGCRRGRLGRARSGSDAHRLLRPVEGPRPSDPLGRPSGGATAYVQPCGTPGTTPLSPRASAAMTRVATEPRQSTPGRPRRTARRAAPVQIPRGALRPARSLVHLSPLSQGARLAGPGHCRAVSGFPM